jgi:hypothetical protein
MTTITNDKELRTQLDSLEIDQQRLLAYKLVRSVIHLCSDIRIEKAISAVESSDASDDDRLNAYKQVKLISTDSYTDCGSEVDWKDQAEHFVMAAATASLTPENMIGTGKSLIWQTAMQAGMANNCEMIEKDGVDIENEAVQQYKLTEEFIT